MNLYRKKDHLVKGMKIDGLNLELRRKRHSVFVTIGKGWTIGTGHKHLSVRPKALEEPTANLLGIHFHDRIGQTNIVLVELVLYDETFMGCFSVSCQSPFGIITHSLSNLNPQPGL